VRSFLSLRSWAALLVLIVAFGAIGGVYVLVRGSAGGAEPAPTNVELVAVTTAITATDNWAVGDGKTIGEATLTLDDGRQLTIFDGTRGEISCISFDAGCVVVADVLGDAVVWFALVDKDDEDGDVRLTLPALVDMRDGGDLGVLQNGWVVRLTQGVDRTCDTETTSLRDFINKFSPDKSVTILDLIADEVTEVICS
jgi:hypothetical protein